MDKVWLTQYPEGVPPEVDLHEYASLKEVIERFCQRFAELPAYSNMGTSLSYRTIEQKSRAFAGYLRGELGLRRGERVAIMMPNLLQYPIALFGVLRAGLVAVNVNPLYTGRELEHQLRDSGAAAIVVLENFAHTLEQVLPKTQVKAVITTQVGDLQPLGKAQLVNLAVKYLKHMVPAWHIHGAVRFLEALRKGKAHALPDVTLGHDDIAFLQYTGGTTGVAKGVILTHGNVVANVLQLVSWIARDLREGKETAVIPLPLYHVYALTLSLGFNTIGANCVLITNPRDLPVFIATLKKIRTTSMIGVNTLYDALLRAPGFSAIDWSHLRVVSAGAMAIQRSVAQRWKAATGVPIVEGYGLSETSPVVTSNRLDIKDWTGFIGLPVPSTEVAILDDGGRPVPTGEVGEICVRGPQLMKGYWNRPDETQRAFTSDGWFRTGDMGSMDERGYIKLTDRKKDMIIVSGFNVFPNEVEEIAMMHPGVLEAAAIGVPDERSGERIKLFVVKSDPSLTVDALLDHCRKSLAGYKVPKLIEFRNEPLPKSPVGKILRRELRPSAAAAPSTTTPEPSPVSAEARPQ